MNNYWQLVDFLLGAKGLVIELSSKWRDPCEWIILLWHLVFNRLVLSQKTEHYETINSPRISSCFTRMNRLPQTQSSGIGQFTNSHQINNDKLLLIWWTCRLVDLLEKYKLQQFNYKMLNWIELTWMRCQVIPPLTEYCTINRLFSDEFKSSQQFNLTVIWAYDAEVKSKSTVCNILTPSFYYKIQIESPISPSIIQ